MQEATSAYDPFHAHPAFQTRPPHPRPPPLQQLPPSSHPRSHPHLHLHHRRCSHHRVQPHPPLPPCLHPRPHDYEWVGPQALWCLCTQPAAGCFTCRLFQMSLYLSTPGKLNLLARSMLRRFFHAPVHSFLTGGLVEKGVSWSLIKPRCCGSAYYVKYRYLFDKSQACRKGALSGLPLVASSYVGRHRLRNGSAICSHLRLAIQYDSEWWVRAHAANLFMHRSRPTRLPSPRIMTSLPPVHRTPCTPPRSFSNG